MTAHEVKWRAHRRREYRKKVRKKYMAMIRQFKINARKQMKMMIDRQRDAMRQRSFKQQFGGFMADNGHFMGGARYISIFQFYKKQKWW